jgi:hypothetical protein
MLNVLYMLHSDVDCNCILPAYIDGTKYAARKSPLRIFHVDVDCNGQLADTNIVHCLKMLIVNL